MTNYRSTASLPVLKERAKLLAALRRFLDERDFFEVTTPLLSHDVLVDRYVEPIAVPLGNETLYLQTSPEFAMKRLLSSGCEQIYQITPAFRLGDRGAFHNVEFTLLEWYRVGDGYEEGMNFLKGLADLFLTDNHSTTFQSFASVFEAKTGMNPHGASAEALRRLADRIAPGYPESFVTSPLTATADDWLDYLFSEKVQPTLGMESPVIIFDYPVSQSQLAKIGPPLDLESGTEKVTRRFELFSRGIELANGYDELTDASLLRSRFEETAQFRQERNQPSLPTESRLLAAMDAGFPKSSGCALGVDRLLMIRLGAKSIDEVISFPIEEA